MLRKQPLQSGLLFLQAQSQERGGDSRGQTVIQGEMDRAVEGRSSAQSAG